MEAELCPWVARLRQLALQCQVVHAVFVNRRDAHAPRDAALLQALLEVD